MRKLICELCGRRYKRVGKKGRRFKCVGCGDEIVVMRWGKRNA